MIFCFEGWCIIIMPNSCRVLLATVRKRRNFEERPIRRRSLSKLRHTTSPIVAQSSIQGQKLAGHESSVRRVAQGVLVVKPEIWSGVPNTSTCHISPLGLPWDLHEKLFFCYPDDQVLASLLMLRVATLAAIEGQLSPTPTAQSLY